MSVPDKAVIVSACLMGVKCRYDGRDALDGALMEAIKDKSAIPVCPEELGGLPTPRPRCEITDGAGEGVLSGLSRVLDENGCDVTGLFIEGAEETLDAARRAGAGEAYLKEGSPSCGVSFIKRKGRREKGHGVAAALLAKEGLKVTGFGG